MARRMTKAIKSPARGSNAWINVSNQKIKVRTNRAKNRAVFMDKMNERKAMNVQRDMTRSNQYYATKRSKSRATKLSAAAAAIMESSEKTERIRAQEETKRQQAVAQYAALINGNQNEPNALDEKAASNEKDNGKGWVNWN